MRGIIRASVLIGCSVTLIVIEAGTQRRGARKGPMPLSYFIENSAIKKEPLLGGRSQAIIERLYDGKNFYVMRSIGHRDDFFKRREIQNQLIASDGGYGPHVYAYDTASGVIVMEFLKSDDGLDFRKKLERLAGMLRLMHTGKPFHTSTPIIDVIRRNFKKSKVFPQGISPTKIARLIERTARQLQKYPLGPTHRDLVPVNIIFTTNGCSLIDYECAAQDDPYFDVATVILSLCKTNSDEDSFMKAYLRREPTLEEKQHLHMAKKLVLLHYGLFHLTHTVIEGGDIDLPIISFYEACVLLKTGKLSMNNNQDKILFVRSMLGLALQLDKENSK